MILESVKEALEKMKKHGLQGDVYGMESRNLAYAINKGEVSDISDFEEVGLGIRVRKDGKLGFAYCVPGKEERGVLKAKELSGFSQKLDLTFPSTEKVSKVKNFDERILTVMDGGEGMDLARDMIEAVRDVKDDIVATNGALILYTDSIAVGNTSGTLLEGSSTSLLAGVTATIHGERTSLTASESDCSRRLDIDFRNLGRSSGEKVDSMRESSDTPTSPQTVVMSPDAFSGIFRFTLVPSISGENVRKNKSVYNGKLGESVADGKVNLVDDPTKDWGMGSRAFDDEGLSCTPLPVISDGVLKNFLYDLKEGVKSRTGSTGNGFRGSFKSPPMISDMNLILKGGDSETDAMFPERGVYIDEVMGAHTANPVSGDFSVVANSAWKIEKGQRAGRLDGMMISGNIHECMLRMELGDDHRRTFFRMGPRQIKLELPSVRISGMSVSGG